MKVKDCMCNHVNFVKPENNYKRLCKNDGSEQQYRVVLLFVMMRKM